MTKMKSFRELNKRVQVIADEIGKGVDDRLRAAALLADQALVLTTPVDTGRARGNWIPTIGAPSTDILPEPASPEAGSNESLRKGEQVSLNWGAGQKAFYVTNNLPYIEKLDRGSSKQAPLGMTKQARRVAINALTAKPILKK